MIPQKIGIPAGDEGVPHGLKVKSAVLRVDDGPRLPASLDAIRMSPKEMAIRCAIEVGHGGDVDGVEPLPPKVEGYPLLSSYNGITTPYNPIVVEGAEEDDDDLDEEDDWCWAPQRKVVEGE